MINSTFAEPATLSSTDTRSAEDPLCVDCDGTLIHTDLFHESFLLLLKTHFMQALLVPLWLVFLGKAETKLRIARLVRIDASTLPYCEQVLGYIAAEKARGRHVVLATASAQPFAESVAACLGCFDQVLATNELDRVNLSGKAKADKLADVFGNRGFEYLGNSSDDYPVWQAAKYISVANASPRVRRAANRFGPVTLVAHRKSSGWRAIFKAMRLHQWLKNLLLFAPLLAAHRVGDPALLATALLAYLAFGLCASSVYILNDMLDIPADRAHPRKKKRPFASGALSLPAGCLLMAALLCATIGLLVRLPLPFGVALATYYALTLAYSFKLKRKAVVDVVLLAMLYTIRILAGAAATHIVPSFWLLAFSMFLFLSLAILKRYSELLDTAGRDKQLPAGRGYRIDDLPALLALGSASGLCAVLVLALYINSADVANMYGSPQLLWAVLPMMLYWVGRVWIKSHRGEMHDDPVVFAAKDKQSLAIGLAMAIVMTVSHVVVGKGILP